jgi:8-hydroxy-5-deazaflavin:NADPH oxidoreductase
MDSVIGLIGAGEVAKTFARFALASGHRVILSNSRSVESLRDVSAQLGDGVRVGTPAEAAAAPLVLLAVPWPRVPEALRELPSWDDRILIDPTNGFRDGTPAGGIVDVGTRSTSEVVASLAPGARVVKTWNTNAMSAFRAPSPATGMKRVQFVSGDDDAAKRIVSDLLASFGFATADLGDLHNGGLLQQVGGPIAGRDFQLSS